MTVGEQLERSRRRRFWAILAVIGAVGMPLGFFIGFNAGRHDVDLGTATSMIPPLGLGLAAVGYALAVTIGTYVFVKSIDEVDLADNLWASAAGFYAYAVLFPCWWLLAKGGFVVEPQDWTIFVAAMFAGLAAYGWRKWRAR